MRARNLQNGQTALVDVTRILSPSKITITFLEPEETILEITKDLRKYCGDNPPPPKRAWRVGDLVAAKTYDGDFWHRGKILSLNSSQNTAMMDWVDFGQTSEEVSLKLAVPLEGEFLEREAVAMEVALLESRAWTEDEIFIVQVLLEQQFRAQMTVEGQTSSSVPLVQIHCDEEDMRQTFMEKCALVARQRCLEPVGGGDASQDSDRRQQVLASLDQTQSPKPGQLPQDDLASSLEKYRNLLSKFSSYPRMPSAPLLKGTHSVQVGKVHSPGLFFLELAKRELPEDVICSLEEMTRLMDESYERSNPGILKLDATARGKQCAVVLRDGHWYRGQITSWRDNSHCGLVMLVDSAEELLIHEPCVRLLMPKFSQLPSVAIPCALAKVAPPQTDSAWSSNAVEFLSSLQGQPLTAVFLENADGDPFRVDLLNLQSESLIARMESEGLLRDLTPAVDRHQQMTPPTEDDSKELLERFQRRVFEVNEEVGWIWVSWLEDLKLFYLHFSSMEDDGVIKKAVDHCDSRYRLEKKQTRPISRPATPGLPCVAFWPREDVWYRAEVMADAGEEGMRVFLVDVGAEAVCRDVRCLMSDPVLMETEAAAVPCALYGFLPTRKLNPGDIDKVKDEMNGCCCTILGRQDDGTHLVCLEHRNGIDVADFLVAHGLVKIKKGSSTERKALDDVSGVEVSNLPMLSLPALDMEGYFEAKIAKIDSLSRIYLHPMPTPSPELVLIRHAIHSLYEEEPSRPLTNPQTGMLCAVNRNDGWHRAVVRSWAKEGNIGTVMLLDEGGEVGVSGGDLTALSVALCRFPIQTFICSLSRVPDTPEKTRQLRNILSSGDRVTIKILGRKEDRGSIVVELFVCLGVETVSLNEVLLRRGLANDVIPLRN